MITPLRRRHRWLAPTAFALSLAGLGAGLAARPTEFVEAARRLRATAGVSLRDSEIHVAPHGRFAIAVEGSPPRRLWLVPHAPLDAPDLLIYLARAAGDPRGPGEDAQVLGPASPVDPTPFELSLGALDARPVVVLYSLGHAARHDALVVGEPGGASQPGKGR